MRRLFLPILLLLAASPASADAASLIDVRVPDDAALETLRSTPGVEPTGHGRPGWAGAVAGSAGLAAPTQTARRRARVTLRARGV